jgi:DNA modification methylase
VCGTFHEKRKWHVCQIPELLLERVIKGHSKPRDTVCDPFVGSGTAVYAAVKLGRKVIGIDQSRLYLDKISEELARREKSQTG